MNKDLEFMQLSIDEAKRSVEDMGKTPLYVGAVVVKDGAVLGKALRHKGKVGSLNLGKSLNKLRHPMHRDTEAQTCSGKGR